MMQAIGVDVPSLLRQLGAEKESVSLSDVVTEASRFFEADAASRSKVVYV